MLLCGGQDEDVNSVIQSLLSVSINLHTFPIIGADAFEDIAVFNIEQS